VRRKGIQVSIQYSCREERLITFIYYKV